MANNITDFSSIVLRKPGLVKDTDLIKSFVHVLKNLKTTISPEGLEYLFKRIVEHLRTFGEIPPTSLTEDIQSLLEDAYNEFYSIVSELTPDADLLTLIQDNDSVILNKFVHIVTDRTLYEKIFHDWHIASTSKGYFSGTETEFRHYVFKFFKLYDNIPENPDTLTTAITADVFNEYFLDPHDEDVDAHGGNLGAFMEDLLPVFELPTISNDTADAIAHEPPYKTNKSFEMFIKTFKFFECSDDTEKRLTDLRSQYVHDSAISPVIDVYKIDEQSLYRPTSLVGLTASSRNYLDWYQEEYYNTVGGTAKHDLFEKDDLKFMLLRKKSNYYSDHLTYLDDPNVAQSIRDIAISEHADIIEYYYKMINLFCEVPDEFAIHCKVRLNKIYTKTKDILNITNHSRSIFAVYLQPYTLGNNTYNRLRMSFDNFNPSMRYTIIDNILEDDYNEVEFIVRVRMDVTEIFCRVGDVLTTWSYPNSLRVYDRTPVTMFIGLFVKHFQHRNNVISYSHIYDAEISDVVIKNLIVGYE